MGMEVTAGEREQEQGGIQENSEKKAQCLTPQTLEEEEEEEDGGMMEGRELKRETMV